MPRNVPQLLQHGLELGPKLTLRPIDDAWVERVYSVARQHFAGADLDGVALADAVREVSHGYIHDRSALAAGRVRASDLVARLKWFSVRDLPKLEVPLTELAVRHALPSGPTWRVLDVGAGVGTSTLGVARVAQGVGVQQLQVHALDRDAEALRVFERLAADVSALATVPIELRTSTTDLTRVPQALENESFHVIVVGFVINELWPDVTALERAERADTWLRDLSRKLTPDGVLVVLEPALREQTRQLQRVRDLLAASGQAPFVFAPCLRIGACPMLDNERDWCHAQVPFALPPKSAEIARLAGLRDHDLTFSYLTLRMQPGHLGSANVDRAAQSASRVVSAPLPSKGKLELIVCDAGGLSRVMRLDRHRSEQNALLDELGRGAVVRLAAQAGADDSGRLRVKAEDCVEPEVYWGRDH